MAFTCSKTYADIPFAHRQHNHDGHCALIHGHNWGFRFTFASDELDENGFVFDFGKLKPLKQALDELDHAFVVNRDDPNRGYLVDHLDDLGLARIVVVESGSAEGMAKWAGERAHRLVKGLSGGRVRVVECVCYEDGKNSATWTPE